MSDIARLVEFLRGRKRMTVLSGAGCSTGSGIPDYRDEDGKLKNALPVQFSDFVNSADVRKRYWARSFAGWNRISTARPNAAHIALAELERLGRVHSLVTQNVDNLHRVAGSRNVIDLHGVLQKIRCLDCSAIGQRSDWQSRLEELNPGWRSEVSAYTPDGDAQLSASACLNFKVPDCPTCGGIVKPDVVFFGESVPVGRISTAAAKLGQSDLLLIVGSSLMVFSGYRFVRLAQKAEIPVVIINRGRTRADAIASRKLSSDCTKLLPQLVDGLAT